MAIQGLNILDMSDPAFHYGRQATASAAPFSGLVVHHTADKPIENLVNYGKRNDPQRGGAFGYHFYVAKDGRIIQGAPLDKRTNHIKPPSAPERAKGIAEGLSNSNAIGVSLVGAENGATPEQLASAEKLGWALLREYGIKPNAVFGHGELQGDRQHREGMDLVEKLRLAQADTGTQAETVDPAAIARRILEQREGGAAPKTAEDFRFGAGSDPASIVRRILAEREKSAAPFDTAPPRTRAEGLAAIEEAGKTWPRRAYEATVSTIKGDAEFDVPEIWVAAPELMGMDREKTAGFRSKLFLADDESAMADIVKEQFPNAQIITDKNGNLYADIPDAGRFALDKSGLSYRDLQEGVKIGALGAASALGAKGGEKLIGPVGRYLGAAAGAGAESALEQAASQWAGSKQEFDKGRVVIGAAFGLGGEAAASALNFIGPKIWRAIRGAKDTGNPDEYLVSLRMQGVDPAEAETRIRQALDAAGAEGFEGDALKRIMDAETLPVPIRLTTGQALQDPALRRAEDIARETTKVFGEDVQAKALDVYRDQQRRLYAGAEEMVERHRRPYYESGRTGSAGEALQSAIAKRRAEDFGRVDEAYRAAREAPNQPFIAADAVTNFTDTMRKHMRSNYTPTSIPETAGLIGDLAGRVVDTAGGKVTGLNIRSMENWRSIASKTANGLQRGSDKTALNELIRAYDEASLGALKDAVIRGDDAAIELWRNAVKERRAVGTFWENRDILEKLTTKKGRQGEFAVASEDVVAEIMGLSVLGKKGAAREIRRLKEFFVEDPEVFGLLKGEALAKLLKLDPAMSEGGRIFSTSIINNLAKARRDYGPVLGELFEPEELAAISQFARVVDNINNAPTSAVTNRSGSGFTALEGGPDMLSRAVSWFGKQFGPGGRAVTAVLTKYLDEGAKSARAETMSQVLAGRYGPRREFLPTGAGAAAGSMLGSDQ